MPKFQFLAAALCASVALPAVAAPAPTVPTTAAPDPQQLAFAARVASALWPDGTYGRMFQGMISGDNGLFETVLDLRPSDLLGAMAEGPPKAGKPGKKAAKPAKAKPAPTLREAMRAEDPNFEERMRITTKVVGEEMTRLAAPIEPKFRDGLTKSLARRFTAAQLGPIADFFATEPGKVYAAQSMSLFIDKDVMLALISSVPAMVKEVPGIMEKVKKATAHLPPPPKHDNPLDDENSDETKSGSPDQQGDVPST